MANKPPKPRIFVDADVLFAGAALPNEHSAGLVFLRMAEIILIEALASEKVITEVIRSLAAKLAAALPAFQLLVSRYLQVVPDPNLTEINALSETDDIKDLPILASAVRKNCTYLVRYIINRMRTLSQC